MATTTPNLSVQGTKAILNPRPAKTPSMNTAPTMSPQEKAEREKEWETYSTTNKDYLLIKPTNPKWLAEDKAEFIKYKKRISHI